MAKELKTDSAKDKNLDNILDDIPETESLEPEVVTSETNQAEIKELKTDSAKETAKRWRITLVESRSYNHPKAKRPFLKDRPLETSDEALAEDCKNNSYFKVQEI